MGASVVREWWRALRKELPQVVLISAVVGLVFGLTMWSCHLKDSGANIEIDDVLFSAKVFVAWFMVSIMLYFPKQKH